MQMKGAVAVGILLAGILFGYMNALAGWEAGAGIGFDSNIDRSVESGESDTYLTAYVSSIREPSGESRLDWTGAATLEGASFASNSDLNYGRINISPGLVYYPHALWSVEVSPFLEARVINDPDQSSVDFGARVGIEQQIREGFYTGQYYIYRDSRADVETYSFTENAIGVFFGVDWTRAFFSEIGYEFSSGDSFRTTGTTSAMPSGRGRHRMYSQAFGTEVIREEVEQNAIGLSAGIAWNPWLSSNIAYTVSTVKGDLGSSTSHAGTLGMGYRF